MGFEVEVAIPALTVFLQGLLSFFSPCVLPLIPLYVSYLAGGAQQRDETGAAVYPRRRVLVNTIFFVVGVSFAFFALGMGFTALGRFFSDNRLLFARISGVVMIVFGIYQMGVLGRSNVLDREHRLPLRPGRWTMGPLPALVLGFTFSFAWTPCVGPTLGGVLLMAGSSASASAGFWLIGLYTLGFVLPFLAVGLFTGRVLNFFRKRQKVVAYTVRIGAALLIFMGVMTLTGFMNNFTGYLSGLGGADISSAPAQSEQEQAAPTPAAAASPVPTATPAPTHSHDTEENAVPAPDFTLTDQYGNEHTLSACQGKTVFLNFWATWCPPCRQEMPEIQALYERYGSNEDSLVVLGVAAPGVGGEGSAEEIAAFLEENGYTFPVVMDTDGSVMADYGIRVFPTTFMIEASGAVYGYLEGAMTGDIMESVVQQTMDAAGG